MSDSKTIFITGATAGIGRAAALYLAERGHHVIASGRRQGALDALHDEAQQRGVRIDTLRLDVTDAASIAGAMAAAEELTQGRGVDVLVNNAGYGLAAPLAEASDADLRKQFDTNVFGLMAVTRAFLAGMMERRAGRIINVSSVGGRITFPMMGAYHASKYAVEAMSDALRMELAPFGIKVSLIEPGPIHTEFVDRMNDAAGPYKGDEHSAYANIFARADMIEKRAMKMAQGPEVISRAIHRAATARRPRARYVAPFSSALMLGFLKLLPIILSDALMRALFGLNPKNVGTTASLRPPSTVGAAKPTRAEVARAEAA
jgi:short-subunit dehydrogenase